MLQCFVERIVTSKEVGVKNTEESRALTILPAVVVICQWLKANSQSIFQDDTVVEQAQ